MQYQKKVKQCKKCSVVAEATAFPKNRSVCRACTASRVKQWATANAERKAIKAAEYQAKPEVRAKRRSRYAEGGAEKNYRNLPTGRALALWHSLRKGALQRGILFEITSEWILAKLLQGKCEVTGIPFVLTPHDNEHSVIAKRQYRNPFSPSVDRIDSEQGYTEENCQVVACIYNFAKGPFKEEALKLFCEAYLKAHDRP